jgi:hypothetical protein
MKSAIPITSNEPLKTVSSAMRLRCPGFLRVANVWARILLAGAIHNTWVDHGFEVEYLQREPFITFFQH